MTPGAVARERRDADLGPAADALVRTHQHDGYPVEGVADPVAWLSPPGLIGAWVAEASGQVVGHVALNRAQGEGAVRLWMEQSGTTEDGIAVLSRLFVDPNARGASAGKALMDAALAYAREHELTLVLDVLTKDAAAIGLYERLGWKRIGITSHTFGANERADAVCFVSPTGRASARP